jgi:hypothetical protein
VTVGIPFLLAVLSWIVLHAASAFTWASFLALVLAIVMIFGGLVGIAYARGSALRIVVRPGEYWGHQAVATETFTHEDGVQIVLVAYLTNTDGDEVRIIDAYLDRGATREQPSVPIKAIAPGETASVSGSFFMPWSATARPWELKARAVYVDQLGRKYRSDRIHFRLFRFNA